MKNTISLVATLALSLLSASAQAEPKAPELYCTATIMSAENDGHGNWSRNPRTESATFRYHDGGAAFFDTFSGEIGNQGFLVMINSRKPLSVSFALKDMAANLPGDDLVAGPFEFKVRNPERKGLQMVRQKGEVMERIELGCSTQPENGGR